MQAHLNALFYTLQAHQYQIVIAYFCFSALSWHYWMKIRSIIMSMVLIGTAAALAVFALSTYMLAIVLYLLYPNYFDHVQATVASLSWVWMQGHELYPNWTTGDVYGLVYGPIIFLINGMALLLNPSIFASKLPGVLSLVAALGATWIILIRKTANCLTSLFLLASLIMLLGPFGVFPYWNRSEPFLILVSVLALLMAFGPSSLMAAVGIGVLAGAAAGLKLHGFIYTVPAAAATLAKVETLRGRVVIAIIGGACAVAAALLPFLEKGASIVDYLQFLRVELNSGLSSSLLVGIIPVTFVLTAPIVGIWIWRKPALYLSDHWLLIASGISVAMITVIGAINGGGSYHLLPLIPICIYGIAVVCVSSKTEAKEIAALIFVSFFLAYGPQLFLNMRWFIYKYQVAAPSEREKIAELITYLDSYPEAQIGISDDEHYSSYFYRVLSVWKGRPLHVDFTVWMNLAYAGVGEEHIVRFIKGCTVPTWILPLGAPFTMISWYNDVPVLSDSFRKTFSTNYQLVRTGQAYQVWECKRAAMRGDIPTIRVGRLLPVPIRAMDRILDAAGGATEDHD
jgi:hypothetical protein